MRSGTGLSLAYMMRMEYFLCDLENPGFLRIWKKFSIMFLEKGPQGLEKLRLSFIFFIFL